MCAEAPESQQRDMSGTDQQPLSASRSCRHRPEVAFNPTLSPLEHTLADEMLVLDIQAERLLSQGEQTVARITEGKTRLL